MVNLDDDDLLSSEGDNRSSNSIDSIDSDNPNVVKLKKKQAAAPIDDDLGYLDDLLDDDDMEGINKDDDIDDDDEDANFGARKMANQKTTN